MRQIAEISDRRVARKMLDHVGHPSDAPEPWPARGPPSQAEQACWLDVIDHEPRADLPTTDFE